jgi:hypothetical protein
VVESTSKFNFFSRGLNDRKTGFLERQKYLFRNFLQTAVYRNSPTVLNQKIPENLKDRFSIDNDLFNAQNKCPEMSPSGTNNSKLSSNKKNKYIFSKPKIKLN